MELKKPTTFSEQVELLKQKNIIISDDNECRQFLSCVNYYYFTGYLLPYINREINKCVYPVSFEQLVNIFNFDIELRNLVAMIVERIEMYIRTTLSNYHALKYGSEGYLDSACFNEKHDTEKFNEVINKSITDHKNTAIVKHHQDKYQGHFPVWVIVEFLPIGSLSYFYGDLKNEDKKDIAKNLYGVNYHILESWMRCITDLRNKCAHCSRLYYWTFSAIPKMPKNINFVPDRRIFSQLYMLKMMYPHQDRWNEDFLNRFINLINKYDSYINYQHLGMPSDWKERLTV